MKSLAACLLSLALLPSCASGAASDYVHNRAYDVVDIFRAHVKAGKGADLKMEWTRLLHAGIGWEQNVLAAGLANRELAVWRQNVFTWGVLLGQHREEITHGLDGPLSGSYGWDFSEGGGSGFETGGANWLELLTFRFSAMLGIGFDVEIRLGEGIDFLVGIFQFDPSGDDYAYSSLASPGS